MGLNEKYGTDRVFNTPLSEQVDNILIKGNKKMITISLDFRIKIMINHNVNESYYFQSFATL